MINKNQKFYWLLVLLILFLGTFFVANNVFAKGPGAQYPEIGTVKDTLRVKGTVTGRWTANQCVGGQQCTYAHTVYSVSGAEYYIDEDKITGSATIKQTAEGYGNGCEGPCEWKKWKYDFDTGDIDISGLSAGEHTFKLCVESSGVTSCVPRTFTIGAPAPSCSDCTYGDCVGTKADFPHCGKEKTKGGILKAWNNCELNDDKRFLCCDGKWYSCDQKETWDWVENAAQDGEKACGYCCDYGKTGKYRWSYCGDGQINTVMVGLMIIVVAEILFKENT